MTRSKEKVNKAIQLLPANVSKIEVQKKNNFRYSVFVEDQFLVGIAEQTLVDLSIKKGVEITPSFYEEILQFEEKQKVKDYLLGLLGRRDHSSKELIDKGIKKGYSRELLTQLTISFQEKKLINNQTFAIKFAKDKVNLKSWGPNKIKAALFEKGISGQQADFAIQSVFSSVDTSEQMLSLVLKRKAHFKRSPEEKRKEKIFRFLSSRGFHSAEIFKHMEQFLSALK